MRPVVLRFKFQDYIGNLAKDRQFYAGQSTSFTLGVKKMKKIFSMFKTGA